MQETQEMPIGSLGQEDPLEEKMETHSSILAGKSYGQRSLVGCSLWGHKEPATTEQSTAAQSVTLEVKESDSSLPNMSWVK